MRTPFFWLCGWVGVSIFVGLIWPETTMWVSGFWIGWSMAIYGQDIADWLKRRQSRS